MSAYVTVTDAAGRVLFRRLATQAEIEEAMQVADEADAEAQASLRRIAAEREQSLAAAAAQERLVLAKAQAEAAMTELVADEEPEIVEVHHATPQGELDEQ